MTRRQQHSQVDLVKREAAAVKRSCCNGQTHAFLQSNAPVYRSNLGLNTLTLILRRYQDYQPQDIPIVEKDGTRVRVMAGPGALGEAVAGPIKMRNPGMLLDVTVGPGASYTQVGRKGSGSYAWGSHVVGPHGSGRSSIFHSGGTSCGVVVGMMRCFKP